MQCSHVFFYQPIPNNSALLFHRISLNITGNTGGNSWYVWVQHIRCVIKFFSTLVKFNTVRYSEWPLVLLNKRKSFIMSKIITTPKVWVVCYPKKISIPALGQFRPLLFHSGENCRFFIWARCTVLYAIHSWLKKNK